MTELIRPLSIGITSFCATNIDDVLLLILFFSQVTAKLRIRQIVAGQYLGFAALTLASMIGFWGSCIIPRPLIGLLGMIPIAIGLQRLLSEEDSINFSEDLTLSEKNFSNRLLSAQTYAIAAITFANGGDNIGVYMPLFASTSWENLLVILVEFFILVGLWCYGSYQLSRISIITEILTSYGNLIVPFVLIGLGILILIDSHTLENRGLAILSLIISSWAVVCFSNQEALNPLLLLTNSKKEQEN